MFDLFKKQVPEPDFERLAVYQNYDGLFFIACENQPSMVLDNGYYVRGIACAAVTEDNKRYAFWDRRGTTLLFKNQYEAIKLAEKVEKAVARDRLLRAEREREDRARANFKPIKVWR